MKFTTEEIRRAMLLYAVTDRAWLRGGETLTGVCRAILDRGVTCLQLREKDLDPDRWEQEARELQALCARYRVPFLVNDSVEIALSMDADGVHVGQSDIRDRDIRAMIGPDKILGISANTVETAVAAEAAGADYIGVGAVFPTGTKQNAKPVTAETMQAIRTAVSIPIVAIGGITLRNLPTLTGCGADGVAVVSAIFAADDPGQAAADLLDAARCAFPAK